MRKAAGIILITLGVLFLCLLIGFVVEFGMSILVAHFYPMYYPVHFAVILLLWSPAVFSVAGGILCLRRKYWRVCLASASFGVLLSVFDSGASIFGWQVIILRGWINWVMVVAAIIAVIFLLRTKREWQEISDSVDGKVSYGG